MATTGATTGSGLGAISVTTAAAASSGSSSGRLNAHAGAVDGATWRQCRDSAAQNAEWHHDGLLCSGNFECLARAGLQRPIRLQQNTAPR